MAIGPMLSAMRRNRIGTALVALQVALTLAIVCNTLSVIQQHVSQVRRPSGLDEDNIFTLQNQWMGEPQDLEARVAADLAVLRSLPDVISAEATGGFPLHGSGASGTVSSRPDQHYAGAWTIAEYFVDERGLDAFGVKLVAGRGFRADEIGVQHADYANHPAAIIVTRALAQLLFRDEDALGQAVYLGSAAPTRIIGIVERTETPWAGLKHLESFVERSAFLPYRYVHNGVWYLVRTRPGAQAAVMKAAPDALYGLSRSRVIDNVSPFAQTRRQIYARGRSSSLMLGALSVLLLVVTACGIVGLTSYWVAQRRRHIGMRRALGARRSDILRYFHTENLLIAGAGVLLGSGLGLAGNIWLVSRLELPRMGVGWVAAGALLILIISQAAVFWPALRAASVSPAVATRSL